MKRQFRLATFFQRLALASLVLMLVPAAWGASKYKVLHSFGGGNDGLDPWAPLLDAKGDLYGVTGGGPGQYGYGVAYELMPQADGRWKELILHTFVSVDGYPWGALVADQGNLYGTTVGGPISNNEVFELSPGSRTWIFNVLYDAGEGRYTTGPGLIMDGFGNLYGGMGRGQYEYGAIAELSPDSGGRVYTDLYDFCGQYGCPDGWELYHPPIWDGPDKLYGTTYYGGTGEQTCLYGCGVIFRMLHNQDGTWTYQVLHRFLESSLADGTSPAAGLVMDASGNFYGSTLFGGPNTNGTIFKLAFSNGHWKETQLYTFPNCDDGCLPGGTMVFDKAGNLYGTASGGIAACDTETCGTVFKLTPQKNGKWKYSVVYKFGGPDGNAPVAVIIDSRGHLFGTTASGGKYNRGVAFEIIP